jgi:hypothetical protein
MVTKKENIANKVLWIIIPLFLLYISQDIYVSIKERIKRPKEAYDMALDNSKRIDEIQKDFNTFTEEFKEFKKEQDSITLKQWKLIIRRR